MWGCWCAVVCYECRYRVWFCVCWVCRVEWGSDIVLASRLVAALMHILVHAVAFVTGGGSGRTEEVLCVLNGLVEIDDVSDGEEGE